VVVAGSRVRINISKGPKQVVLPSVIGLLYDQASAQLQAAGFGVKRNDVDSTEPANKVIDQSPTGNTLVTQGTTITLTVSKGPPTVQVPDVTNQDADTAKATLVAAGFKVKVLSTDTQDATQDNRVVAQDPAGLTDAKPGSLVTITVAHLSVPPPTTPGTPGTPGTTATTTTP
jgi:serine/threonine-protein kinase